MTKSIQPGELCVIIKEDPAYGENVGAFLRARVTEGSCTHCGKTLWSFDEASRPPLCGFIRGIFPVYASRSDETPEAMLMHADQLLPIRDPDAEVTEKEKNELPATV